ncbi:hypothetical protein, unlikely [Trypanosoma congolense IL3000]|uniref:Uncharacterized protein n=1 Tax=Trypanosoma congolense (strain IL3000) TaxID=1068625 RepID=F9W887_TRYCI|nr:hypothetical protein, unlikely [Trypanosoma congolense IL3000]
MIRGGEKNIAMQSSVLCAFGISLHGACLFHLLLSMLPMHVVAVLSVGVVEGCVAAGGFSFLFGMILFSPLVKPSILWPWSSSAFFRHYWYYYFVAFPTPTLPLACGVHVETIIRDNERRGSLVLVLVQQGALSLVSLTRCVSIVSL